MIESKRTTYRLEFEFMSQIGGYYRLSTSDTLIVGEHNRVILEKLAGDIREFMKLKEMPDWMKEEQLAKTFPGDGTDAVEQKGPVTRSRSKK